MPRKTPADRLLLLTLMLEAAVKVEDWKEVTELLNARAAMIGEIDSASDELLKEIGAAEERMLTMLRARVKAVKADLRNLSAALRIASPYTRVPRESSLSLAS